MPPRIFPPSRPTSFLCCKHIHIRSPRQYATAAAITSAPSHEQIAQPSLPIARYPSSQPPSFKPPEFRKSQLLRQYASLIRSAPLLLLFQHNNLKSAEWVAIRRELAKALQKVDDARIAAGYPAEGLAQGIKIQIIQTGIFSAALRIVEHYRPSQQVTPDPQSPRLGDGLTHTLSKAANEAIENKTAGSLEPLLSGPLALLTFPNVSPDHLKAALTILAPQAPVFPAPTRKANPGWHDPPVQAGVQKLLLLGARVEGRTFDVENTRWVGGMDGGLEGLRAQLVGMLQGFGAGITNVLEGVGRSVYFTVEGRRMMLEDEAKPKEDETKTQEAK